MNVVAWIATALLAVVLLPAGLMKVSRPRAELIEKNMGWAADFSPAMIKTIGSLEVLAVVGLVVPPLVGVAAWLAVAAAIGVVLLMLGAAATHVRRGELPMVGLNLGIVVLAAVVIWGRVA